MRPHVLAAAVVVALPLMATTADAQRIRFAEMDANNDGRITREEWRGSLRSFIVHDWNNDGVLSGEEVRVGGRREAPTVDPDFDEGRRELRDWTAQRFTRTDVNRDGRITRAEWPYDWESFNRADRNRDRILTRQEFLNEDVVEDDRGDEFVNLDLNGNGRIERSEWHGTRQSFEWLDRNNDNVLSYAEVTGETTPAPSTSSDLFTRLDVDRSGAIERDEWQWSDISFNGRDRNNDGRLSRAELQPAETGAVGTTGRTLVIDAQTRWTDTGLDVRAGQFITLHAEGTVQMSSDANDIADPWGARSGRKAANSPVNTMPAGGIIAMINGSTPVFIGNRTDTRVRVPASGRLYLGINDDYLNDNRGEFRVTINVER
jgi:Ca2+-binding EF-hand superfamily protein